MSEIKNIRDQFISKLENDLSIDRINEIKTELFGKNGLISSKFKTIGSIPETDRKKFASDLNQAKDELQNLITSKIINGLSKCGIVIDRKILAEIAYDSPEAFKTIVQKAQSALN